MKDHFRWDKTPDSDAIRLRQEELWVYKALLEVISSTNSDEVPKKDDKGNIVKDEKGNPVMERVAIKDHSQASVKRIEWIQIGADAIGAWAAADQSVFKAPDAAAAASAAAAANPRAAPAPATRDAAAASAADSKEQLMKDRYVDEKGAPLEGDAKGPYSEFKMMPVSMKLHIDQRKISKLLVECVNSPMPIEVRRVRIRPGAGEMLEPGAAAAAAPAVGARDNYRRVESRAPTRMPGPAAGGEEGEGGSYDLPVEIQGIIYIYNPPDVNTLGTGTAAEKTAEPAPGAAPGADAGAAKPAEAAPAK